MNMTTTPKAYPALPLVIFMILFSIIAAWDYAKKSPAIDFYQFWLIGKSGLVKKSTNIYSESFRKEFGLKSLNDAREMNASERQLLAAEQRSELETYSTPFLYSFFFLLRSFTYDAGLNLFTILSIASIFFCISIICYLLQFTLHQAAVVILFLFACSEPLLSELRVGNVNGLQLGIIGLYLAIITWSRNEYRRFFAGMLLGFLVIFKPNTVYVVMTLCLYWLINGYFRKMLFQLAGMIVAGLLAIAYSSSLFGTIYCWKYWLESIQSLPGDICTIQMGNMAMVRLLIESTGINISFVSVLFYTGATICCFWISRKRVHDYNFLNSGYCAEAREDLQIICIGLLLYLISSPLVWLHYFLLAIPASLVILKGEHVQKQYGSSTFFVNRLISLALFLCLSINPMRILLQINLKIQIAIITTICANMAFILLLFGLVVNNIHRQTEATKR